jgi:hypothetical protein
VGTTYGPGAYAPHRGDQRCDAKDVHDAGEIVGEHVQRHLGAHLLQRLHQEVGRAHPGLDRAEGMLGRLAPLTHLFRILVEPARHRLEDVLMLPSGDAAFLAGCFAGWCMRECWGMPSHPVFGLLRPGSSGQSGEADCENRTHSKAHERHGRGVAISTAG